MKRHLPWIVTAAAALLVLFIAFAPAGETGRHWREFGRLPVLVSGRIKPLDTVARTSLLALHDKQTLRVPGERPLSAIEWLAGLCFLPARADQQPVFVINDPQVLGLFGWQQGSTRHFSFAQLAPRLDEVVRQAQLADQVEAPARSAFQRHILELYRQIDTYQRLKNSLQPEDAAEFSQDVAAYERVLGPGMAAAKDFDTAAPNTATPELRTFLGFVDGFRRLGEFASMRVVPPLDPKDAKERLQWETLGTGLAESAGSGAIHPAVRGYVALGAAYRARDTGAFNAALAGLTASMQERYAGEMRKAGHEAFFNRFEPFYLATAIYVAVFILACVSWLTGPGTVRRTAYLLTGLALSIHTIGIVFRMYLEGRPPVTNLYSSAVFVGWAAVVLGFTLERIYRNGFGSVVSGTIGFCTLLVAHNLALVSGGDTMEVMRAVLDNNFWLATHVVAITVGYSATFLAGFLAIVYILLGSFSSWLKKEFTADSAATIGAATVPGAGAVASATRVPGETNGRALTRMTYGIICFATLFSFVGTVLGGIWADQSWGRFWGWDPKENGAALIVLWNAIILHARWGGFIRERGMMIMAVFGNIVTAWSWFGVNMLGVGLHSYGFMDKAFIALLGWVGFNLAIMALGAVAPRLAGTQQPPLPSPSPTAARAAVR